MGKRAIRRWVYGVLIILALFLSLKIKVNEKNNVQGYIVDNYLTKYRRVVSPEEIVNIDVKSYQLTIDPQYLKAIYDAYDLKTADIQWEKYPGQLKYKKKTLNVIVSGHANTPSCHKNDSMISLRVKVNGKGKIHGMKKFSFILFRPMGNRPMALKLFGDELDYPVKPSKLVHLVINDSLNWPMHFEPSNKSYFKKLKCNYKKVKLFKSAVQCYSHSIEDVKKWRKIDSTIVDKSFLKYLDSNYEFNDIERSYLVRHLAIQFLLDLSGHGLSGENFVFVLDKEKNGFPILTRSDIPGVCKTSFGNVYDHYKDQIKKFEIEHGVEKLFSPLLKQKSFREDVRQHIRTVLKNRVNIIEDFMDYNSTTEKLYSGKFLDVHFNWRDRCETDERVFLPHVSPCTLNHNLDFWESKVDDDSFWNI